MGVLCVFPYLEENLRCLRARAAARQATVGMNAYITSTGAFLPGPPIGNDEIEDSSRPCRGASRAGCKSRILKANGIQTRHYAIDRAQRTTHSNVGDGGRGGARLHGRVAAAAALDRHAELRDDAGRPGDSRVRQHGAGGLGYSGSRAAYRARHLLEQCHGGQGGRATRSGRRAIECARRRQRARVALLKSTRYEAAGGYEAIDFNSEFLRWMLSDGAGAWLLESEPRGRCLRVDWIRSFSHADAFPVCMSIGHAADRADTRTWQDFATYAEAEAAGALLIRQDVRLLDHDREARRGRRAAADRGGRCSTRSDSITLLCHYSSHHFRSKIFDLLEMCGASIAAGKVVHESVHAGQHRRASILIMLDDFLREGRAELGDTLLCMVPESGRFNTCLYASHRGGGLRCHRTDGSGRPAVLSELGQATLRRLLRAWFDFERRLATRADHAAPGPRHVHAQTTTSGCC